MHAQAVKNLSAEDYRLIEEEHFRLHEVLDFLRVACCNLENQLGCQTCTREKLSSCQGQLTSFSYNLTNLYDNHFNGPYGGEGTDNFLPFKADPQKSAKVLSALWIMTDALMTLNAIAQKPQPIPNAPKQKELAYA